MCQVASLEQGPAASDVRDVYAFLSMLAMFCYFTLLVDFSAWAQRKVSRYLRVAFCKQPDARTDVPI